jgi:hypothetical protein
MTELVVSADEYDSKRHTSKRPDAFMEMTSVTMQFMKMAMRQSQTQSPTCPIMVHLWQHLV